MMTSSSPFEALCPTRDVSALSACFEPVDDGSTEPLPVSGAAVELEDGNRFWLTRLPAINTTYHRAAEVLEIGASSIFELDGAGEAGNKETKRPYFWDVLSSEFFAHCYCGDLSSARELMRVIESQCVVNAAQTQVVVAECDDLPIQVYLFEFEPEGLGIVHLAHGVEWDHDFQALENMWREAAPAVFAKLPYIFDSDDYFATYDFYCSDSFVKQTSEELALAAWAHCLNKDYLRECLVDNEDNLAHLDRFEVLLEARELEKVSAHADALGTAPRL